MLLSVQLVIQFNLVAQSCPPLCDTMDSAHQASLSISNSQSLLKLMSIALVIVSNQIIFCRPLLLLPSIFPSIKSLFQWVGSSHQVAKVLEVQLQHQSFQWIFRTNFLWDGLVGSPCIPGDSQEFSPTPQFESICSLALSFLYSPTFTSIHDYIALTRQTFVGKVMPLLLIMLSRLVITFLPRSKRLLISWLQSPSAVILEPPKIKSDTVCTVSLSICHEAMGLDAMIFVFWMLSQLFHSLLSLSSRGFLAPLHFLP